jgi:AraC family transcriptional regulator
MGQIDPARRGPILRPRHRKIKETGETIMMLARNFETIGARRGQSVTLPPIAIHDETVWRQAPDDAIAAQSSAIATRWRSLDEKTVETIAETPEDISVIAIALRNMNTRFASSGRILHDGTAAPGTLLLSGPGTSVKGIYRGAYDELHLHVSNEMVAECSREIGRERDEGLCSGAMVARDPVVERLARSLIEGDEIGGSLCQIYLDCISTAIVARLLASVHRPNSRRMPELVPWRLKRAIDYIEARLAEPLRLADIASAAGLTRMHFAAQFRAATGLRPHEYVLRRRIERAQRMLVTNKVSLVDVALSVGFQTQAHFTSIFKRFVGQPPRAWRQMQQSLAA